MAVGRSDAEPLGDAGAVALDQHVGVGHQPQGQVDTLGALEVDGDRAATAAEHVGRWWDAGAGPAAT